MHNDNQQYTNTVDRNTQTFMNKARPTEPLKAPMWAKILIGLSVLPALAIVVFIIYIFANMNSGMDELQAAADKKQQTLSSLSIVSGEKVEAEAHVNGDGLTADRDPRQSTYAQAIVHAKGVFGDVLSDITRNLQQEGYLIESDQQGNPYYRISGDTLEMRFIKNDDVIHVRFIASSIFACPEGKGCHNTQDYVPQGVPLADLSEFNSVPVTQVKVLFADKNFYQARLT